jgi:hypothetical protein
VPLSRGFAGLKNNFARSWRNSFRATARKLLDRLHHLDMLAPEPRLGTSNADVDDADRFPRERSKRNGLTNNGAAPGIQRSINL